MRIKRDMFVAIRLGLFVAPSLVIGWAQAAQAETRGFVISTFSTGTYSDPSSCPNGGNGGSIDVEKRQLRKLGYSASEIASILETGVDRSGKKRRDLSTLRGPKNAPVDFHNNPGMAVEPKIELMNGRYAPGFNLDGNDATGYINPYTGAKGIDNQLLRVIGCFAAYNITLPVKPFYEDVMWDTMIDTMPAWVVSVSGKDLSKDGKVTVTFDRALQHVRRNASGGGLVDATYMLERKSRSRSVFNGTIRNGVLSLAPGKLHVEGEAPIFTELRLDKVQASLRFTPSGTLEGFIGGYQPWRDFYYMASSAGEINIGLDMPGIYHNFRRYADAGRNPKTGQNTMISAAYWIVAVPAFLATTDKKLVATAGGVRRKTAPWFKPKAADTAE